MKLKIKSPATATAPTRDVLYGTGITKRSAAKARTTAKKRDALLQKLKAREIGTNRNIQSAVLAPTTELDSQYAARKAAVRQLDESQLHAVRSIVQQQYACLIGKAGTGKTTTAKAILYWLRRLHPELAIDDIAICAFTGKAVQQIKLSIPSKYHSCCSTIHALLEFAPVDEEIIDDETGQLRVRRVFRPQRTATNPLTKKLIIIDETGMLGTHLWQQLHNACLPTTRILMMGDINQIPPVIGHSILGFAGLKWPTFTLETLHRNAGQIAINAHAILEGKWPKEDQTCWRHVQLPDSGTQAQMKIIGAIQALHKAGKFNPQTDAIITAQNVGILGQEALNSKLVHYFNKPQTVQGVVVNPRVPIDAGATRPIYAVGDKVMLLANDNDRGLTNGMTGIITSIATNPKYNGQATADLARQHAANCTLNLADLADDLHSAIAEAKEAQGSDDDTNEEKERQASHIVYVKFPDYDEEVSFSTAGDFRRIQLAYAFTCHKSQGSEYDTVILVLHSTNAVMLTREWLYTAVTRARKRVVILHNSRGFKLALNRQAIKGKTIQEKLKSFNKLQERNRASGDEETFTLPEPFQLTIDDSLFEQITAEIPADAM